MFKILATGFLLLFFACIIPAPLVLIAYLLFGWIAYLKWVAPQIQMNWAGAGSALLSFMGVLAFGHLMGRWLWKEIQFSGQGRTWKWSWTIAGALIVVLMFTAGISAVGITHQTAWLVRSPRPIFSYGPSRERANRVKCAANMKSLAQAMLLFAEKHEGSLPDTIEEVVDELTPEEFICPSSDAEKAEGKTTSELVAQLRSDDLHCSYVYLGRGLKTPLARGQVILCEPLNNHRDEGMNVLFGDMEVRWLTPADAEAVLGNPGP